MLRSLKRYVRNLLGGGYLPCYVIWERPLILVAYDSDFIAEKASFLKQFAAYPEIHLFLQLGWQHETPQMAEPFAAELRDIQFQCPALSVTVLANSPREVEVLSTLGLRVVHCHQNAFIEESRYPVVPGVAKEFDAIYIARITPFKRHQLAEKVVSLRLIGDYYEKENEYVSKTLKAFPQAIYTRIVPSRKVYREIARARCGLCLSQEEGAMFVSAEYLLGGLPVVNTENIGGRDYLFPDFAVKQVEDSPEAVARAVQEFSRNPIDPLKIREATLAKMATFRRVFLAQLDSIMAEAHQRDATIPARFTGKLPHKLGIRCTRMPWVNWRHGLKRK